MLNQSLEQGFVAGLKAALLTEFAERVSPVGSVLAAKQSAGASCGCVCAWFI